MKTEEIIEKAIKQAIKSNPDLQNLDDPYSYICDNIAQSGNVLEDMFPFKEDETSIQWAERIESEIDSVWRNLT